MPQMQTESQEKVKEPVSVGFHSKSSCFTESTAELSAEAGYKIDSIINIPRSENKFSLLGRKDYMADKRKLDFLNRARGSWVNDKDFDKNQKKRRTLELKETRRMRACTF